MEIIVKTVNMWSGARKAHFALVCPEGDEPAAQPDVQTEGAGSGEDAQPPGSGAGLCSPAGGVRAPGPPAQPAPAHAQPGSVSG